MKNKEIVSEIINDLRALNIDDRVSSRYILSKLNSYVALYIKRENDQMRLFNFDNIWTTIECIRLEQSTNVECCEISIPRCSNWAKSRHKLPELFITKFGPAIRSVATVRRDLVFQKTTPRDYAKVLRRRYVNKEKRYYWLENNHLVIPDSEIELVTIEAYFRDNGIARLMSECDPGDCDNKKSSCYNPLEEEWICPSHLQSQVKQDTVSNLFSFYKRNIVDEIPNLDTNQKTTGR